MKGRDYKQVFQSLDQFCLLIDKDLKVLDVSDGYLKEFKFRRIDVIKSRLDLVSPFDESKKYAAAVTASVKIQFEAGVSGQIPPPDRFIMGGWAHTSVALPGGGNTVDMVMHEFRKESHQVASLESTVAELKRSNEELAMFAMTASHDIKAPFRTVGNFLSMIEEKLKSNGLSDQFKLYFEKIYDARNRVESLLDDLLTYSMVSSAAEHVPVRVDLNLALQDAVNNLESTIRERKAEVKVNGKLPVVSGKYIQMVQLFQNLISNAIKFNLETPHISVSFKNHVDNVEVIVLDNGMGIDERHFTKIFDVFSRLYSPSDFKGSGLGLSICRKIVEQHGGRIWVDSSSRKGTAFHFTLLKTP